MRIFFHSLEQIMFTTKKKNQIRDIFSRSRKKNTDTVTFSKQIKNINQTN